LTRASLFAPALCADIADSRPGVTFMFTVPIKPAAGVTEGGDGAVSGFFAQALTRKPLKATPVLASNSFLSNRIWSIPR
jgi:hypothetical protein